MIDGEEKEELRPRKLSSLFLCLLILLLEKLTVLHLPREWLKGAVHLAGGAPAAFAFALIFFGWKRLRTFAAEIWPLRRPLLVAHALSIAFLFAMQRWSAHRISFLEAPGTPTFVFKLVWTALLVLSVVTLLAACFPLHALKRIARSLGLVWLYALAFAACLLLLRAVGDRAWQNASNGALQVLHDLCFRQASTLLRHLYPYVISVPEKHLLGTPRYTIEVSWLCSGIEGLGMVALLVVVWLFISRSELILHRALLVAPVALVLTWFANILRLVLLISIGDHGHPFIASNGFHAQAGWISLNLIALGGLALVQRTAWFRKDGAMRLEARSAPSAATNDYTVYLLPFTTIIAVSLFTQAFTLGFDSLYPLRFLAALLVLFLLRKHYLRMDWRFSWPGLLAGLVVGLGWIALDLRHHDITFEQFQTAAVLARTSAIKRWGWIAIRVAAASITVPIAEELAFRGCFARSVERPDFARMPYRSMGWLSLGVSSIAFGVMHASMWLPGIAAGALFWYVAKLRNRLGEAVAAHAVANALISVAAVTRHDYSMW